MTPDPTEPLSEPIPTPRTDEQEFYSYSEDEHCEQRAELVTTANFARQLETELAHSLAREAAMRLDYIQRGNLLETTRWRCQQAFKTDRGHVCESRKTVEAVAQMVEAFQKSHPALSLTAGADLLALAKRLGDALRAAGRIIRGKYTQWHYAGGVDDCSHGYSAGIPCPKCDQVAVDAALAELEASK